MAKKKVVKPQVYKRKIPKGIKPKVISDELIAEALKATKGLQYLAAEKIGMSATHLSQRIAGSEYLQEAREHAIQKRIDIAELNLSELTEEKELGAITFMLKTKGKDRGYSEAAQVSVDPQAQAGMLALMTQFADAQAHYSARKIVDSNKSEE